MYSSDTKRDEKHDQKKHNLGVKWWLAQQCLTFVCLFGCLRVSQQNFCLGFEKPEMPEKQLLRIGKFNNLHIFEKCNIFPDQASLYHFSLTHSLNMDKDTLDTGLHTTIINLWKTNINSFWTVFWLQVQGVSFNWSYPKNHKYGKKLKYQNWSSPKIHKYQNWSPPQKTETRTIVFHSRENPGQQLIRCLTIWKTDCQLSCRLWSPTWWWPVDT